MRSSLKARGIGIRRAAPLGLTLIELLVTLLLTAVLSVMGFRVLERFVISQEGLIQQAAFQRSLALTWSQLEADLKPFASLSPKQRSDMLRIDEDGFLIGMFYWQVQEGGVLSRQILGQSVPTAFMPRVSEARLALWVAGEERDLTAASGPDLQRFARQDLGLVFEIRLVGESNALRKVFFLPASP